MSDTNTLLRTTSGSSVSKSFDSNCGHFTDGEDVSMPTSPKQPTQVYETTEGSAERKQLLDKFNRYNVADWLDSLGLLSLNNIFEQHEFDMDAAALIDEQILDEMGVGWMGPRLKILDSVSKMRSAGFGGVKGVGTIAAEKPGVKLRFVPTPQEYHPCLPKEADQNDNSSHNVWKKWFVLGNSVFSNARTLGGIPLDYGHPKQSKHSTWLQCKHFIKGAHYRLVSAIYVLFITFQSFNLWDICTVGASVICSQLLMHHQINVDPHPALFVNMIVFPLSFSITSAYRRRERALADLSTLKAATQSLFLLFRDWKDKSHGRLGNDFLFETGDCVLNLFATIRDYLTCKYEPNKQQQLAEVYSMFSKISMFIEMLRQHSTVPSPLLTRPIHDLQLMITTFEKLRIVADYRTPSSIRSYLQIFLLIAVVGLSPYFAFLGLTYSTKISLLCSIIVPVSYCCLHNVQIALENLFGCHEDDISLDYLRSVETITAIALQEKAETGYTYAPLPKTKHSHPNLTRLTFVAPRTVDHHS